jgi:hypothetical protein
MAKLTRVDTIIDKISANGNAVIRSVKLTIATMAGIKNRDIWPKRGLAAISIDVGIHLIVIKIINNAAMPSNAGGVFI